MSDKGTFLRVIVKPKSKNKEFVEERTENSFIVNLESAAKKGKANTELLKRLSKVLEISTSEIFLVSGHKSREKILLIERLSVSDIEEKLEI